MISLALEAWFSSVLSKYFNGGIFISISSLPFVHLRCVDSYLGILMELQIPSLDS